MPRSTPYQSGFLSQSRHSSSGLAIVIALHGVALAVAFLVKSGTIPIIDSGEPPTVELINPIDDPPPLLPEPEVETELPPPLVTQPIIPLPPDRVTFVDPPISNPNPPVRPSPPIATVAPDPVFVEARVHPSHRRALQPRYPTGPLRQDLEGSCTIRVRIAPNGRVTAAQQVSATHPAFCEATERHALRRWRFEPATRDGVPVESWQQHVVEFRIS